MTDVANGAIRRCRREREIERETTGVTGDVYPPSFGKNILDYHHPPPGKIFDWGDKNNKGGNLIP